MQMELESALQELLAVMTREQAESWLKSPNPLLSFDTPGARILSGDFEAVRALIEALADGIVV